MNAVDLTEIKKIPIIDIAIKLGIDVKMNKAMCFNGHDKNTPSLSFNQKNNTWKCFGACDKGGDNISLVAEYLQISFLESIKWFERYGIYQTKFIREIKSKVRHPQKISISLKEDALPDDEIYSWLIDRCGEVSSHVGVEYLKNHGITNEIAIKYKVKELINSEKATNSLVAKWGIERLIKSGLINLGKYGEPKLIWRNYCLLFPFFEGNKLMYIQGRMFSGKTKYINLKGVGKPLYNVNRLKELNKLSRIHICEGIPDALAMESCEFKAVAVLGATSFRKEWVQLFKGFETILVPDGDGGGTTFAKAIQKYFNEAGESIRVMSLPENKDASDVLAEIRGKN